MKQEDKLRRSLRDYYDSADVPYEEEEWAKAGALLRSEKRKRRVGYAVFAFVTLLGVALTFSTFYNRGVEKEKLSSQTVIVDQSIAKKKESTRNNGMRPIKQASETIPHTIKRKPGQNSITKSLTSYTRSNALSIKHDTSGGFSYTVSLPEREEKYVVLKKAVVSGNPAGSANESGQQITKTLLNEENTPLPEAENNTGAEEITRKASENIKDEQVVTAINENYTSTINSPGDIKTDSVSRALHPTSTIKNTTASISEKEHIPMESPTRSEQAGTGFLVASETSQVEDEFAIKDSVSRFLFESVSEGMFYEAGAAWLYGWKGPVNVDARGFSPIAGINYMNKITRRCALSFGAQYLQIPHLTNSSKISRVSSYTYGEQTKVTVITPIALHYVLLPFRFYYHVNRKNCFGAGLNLSYLMNVEAKVVTFNERLGITENYSSTKLSGYMQGFSWFDTQATLFYTRRINSRFGIKTELFIGMTDVKQDAFFGLNNKERNSGGKITMIYYAFRKKDHK
jgi:hypothetical protein